MASITSNLVPEDPYLWSVDELVHELCYNPEPIWTSKAKRALMPATHVLEKALRDNVLDGESFMSMELPDINNELKLAAFGTKRNLYKVITFFRSISSEYRRQHIVENVMPYINGVESPQITASHMSVRPQSVTYGNQNPFHTYDSPHPSHAFANTPAQWPTPTRPYGRRQPVEDGSLQMPNALDIQQPTSTRLSASELLQCTPSPVPQMRKPLAHPDEEPARPPLEVQTKIKKRVAPTFVAHITPDHVTTFKTKHNRAESTKSPPDVESEDYNVTYAGLVDDAETEREFVISESTKLLGERQQVARVVKNLLRNQHSIHRLGRDDSHRGPVQTRKDVVKPANQTHPEEINENPFLVEEEQPLDDENVDTAGIPDDLPRELKQLLANHPPVDNDDGFAIYGESGDENEYDQKTLDEMADEDEDRKRRPPPARTLTKTAVNAAIDEAIAEMIAEWHEGKLPQVQRKGFRLWNKVTRNQTGAHHIDRSTFWIDRFESSIRKFRVAIADDTWHKVSDVKAQSRSLEESVFQREEHMYYLSILQSDKPPPRPDPLALFRAKAINRPDVPEGEEILDSESEPSSDDGFIDDDMSSDGSIPHDGPRTTQRPAGLRPDSEVETPASETSEIDSDTMPTAEAASPASTDEPAETVDNADTDDSDDEILGSARRKPLPKPSSRGSMAVASFRKQRLSQRLIEASDESENDLDADLNGPRPLPKTQYRDFGSKPDEPIEFMSSSPAPEFNDQDTSIGSVRTPSLNPGTESPKPRNRKLLRESSFLSTPASSSPSSRSLKFASSADDGPNLEDVEAIRDLDWETITEEEDHRRALARAVYDLDRSSATKLSSYVENICAHPDRARELLKSSLLVYGEPDEVIEGVAARDQALASRLGLLFLTYNTASSCMDEEPVSHDDLDSTFESVASSSRKFYSILRLVLKAYCASGKFEKRRGKKRKSDNFEALDELDDDTDLPMPDEAQDQENFDVPAHRSAKKRKKKVIQSQEAETQQADDRARVADQERLRISMLQKLSQMDNNDDDDINKYSMHPVSFNPEAPTIYLDPHIGQKVKPHQENGIQFMWREITAGKGCMLAHTMGLGKTMQVISLLVTIAQASQSDDPEIRDQVPGNLQESRTLILCPPTLVDNWYDEILMWTPPGSPVLGDVMKIVSATKKSERKSHIKSWTRDGGVLLMSYSLFKQIVEKKSDFIPDHLRDAYAEKLTDGPNIVITDEAHHMKNPKTAIAKATMKFATKARIALTGSPLSNHLEEYHQMVDWVSPNYLGTLVQFKAKYSEPIKEGLYSDSSSYERKTSARKLMVLKKTLEPKICRADISAIAKDMPNKAEFFITVPLTVLQKDAYGKYVKHMLRDHSDGSGGSSQQAKIWVWLGVLSLLLNHPSAFVKKLSEANKSEATTPDEHREGSVDTDDLDLPADVPVEVPADVSISSTGLSSAAIEDLLSVFNTMTRDVLHDEQQSYRSLLTARIVKESMRIDEKVLIFSHSIPTLNYLEDLLESLGCTYARIDGGTSMSSRQDVVKGFNKEEDTQVMLISTKAGGLGLNLQGANRVIIYDFNFNPTWEEQAVGRAYRLGQQKHVFVYRFRAGGTFEETTYNMSIFKTQLFARVVDKRNPMRFASKRLSDYLFPPQDVEQSELDECRGKDPQVLDRILEQETCIRKVELTETFQVEEDDELTPEEIKQAEQEYQDEVLARTDPGKLLRLQAERRATQQVQNVRNAQQQQQLSGRAIVSQQASSARFVSTRYPQMPADLRQGFYPPPNGLSTSRSNAAQDDMNLDISHTPLSRSTSIGPEHIPQVDGSDEKRDDSLDCKPQ
jgi:SNF2 family DNA or RNA helicase